MTENSTAAAGQTTGRRKRWTRFLFRGGLLALAAGMVLLLAAWGLLQSAWGRKELALRAGQLLERTSGWRVTVEGVQRGLPWQVGLRFLRLADVSGVWLELADCRVHLRLGPLLRGRIRVTSLSCERLVLHRLPAVGSDAGEDDSRGEAAGLPDVTIDSFYIEELYLGEAVVVEPLRLRLGGHVLRPSEHRLEAVLRVVLLDAGGRGRVAGSVSLEGSSPVCRLDLDWSEADPVLARLAGVPQLNPLNLQVRCSGPPAALDVAASLAGGAGQLIRIEGHVTYHERNIEMALDGRVYPDAWPMEPVADVVLPERIDWSLEAKAARPPEGDAAVRVTLGAAALAWTDWAGRDPHLVAEWRLQTLAPGGQGALPRGTFSMQGRLAELSAPAQILTRPLRDLVWNLEGRTGDAGLRVEALQLDLAGVEVSGSAAWKPLQHSLGADLSWHCEALSALPLAGVQGVGGSVAGRTVATVSGPPGPLSMSTELTWSNPEVGGVSLEHLAEPRVDARIVGTWQENIVDLDRLELTVGRQHQVKLAGSLDTQTLLGQVQIAAVCPALEDARAFSGQVPAGTWEGRGFLALVPQGLVLDMDWQAAGLTWGEHAIPIATGAWQMTWDDPFAGGTPRLGLKAQGQVDAAGWFAPAAAARYTADLQWRDPERIVLRYLQVTADGLAVTAAGTVNPHAGTLAARADLHLHAPGGMELRPDLHIRGMATLSATARGALAAPLLDATLTTADLSLGGEHLRNLVAAVNATEQDGWAGSATIDGVVRDLPLGLRVDWRVAETGLSMRGIRLQGPGTELAGNLDIRTADQLLSGDLRGSATEAVLRPWLDAQINGNAELKADLAATPAGQQVDLELRLESLHTPWGAVESLTLDGVIDDLLGTPRGVLNARLAGAHGDQWSVPDARLRLAGSSAAAQFQVDGAGVWGGEGVSVSCSGSAERRGRVALDAFFAGFGATTVELQEPAELLQEAGVVTLPHLALSVGRGRLHANMVLQSDRLRGRLELAGLELGDLAPVVSGITAGTLDGALELSGSPPMPRLDLVLSAEGLTLMRNLDQQLFAGSARLAAEYDQGCLQGHLAVRGAGGEKVDARGKLPLGLSLAPGGYAWDPQQPWSAGLQVDADLGQLLLPLLPDGTVFQGRLLGELGVAGTPAHPLVEGYLELLHGQFENYLTGSTLRHLRLRLDGAGNELRLQNLQADDGHSGRLEGKGRWLLASQAADAIGFTLTLEDFLLHDQPELSLVAAGSLTLAGAPKDLALSGTLVVIPVEARIVDSRDEVVNLDVVETRGGVPLSPGPAPRRARTDAEPAPGPLGVVALDLTIRSPGRVFVRGRGLDTEWRGDLRISGTTAQPQLAGELAVVRGTYTMGARRLRIVEGRLSFDGAYPILPTIHVVAEDTTADLVARVIFSGPLDAPVLRLESQPSMPTDEILARVLFRRSTGQISAFQALTLASVVEDFTTGGSAFDVNERLRRLTGLDQVGIVTRDDAEGASSLEVGKYLTDRVYVQVDRGLGATADNRITVEIEITPRFSVETSAGTAGGGVGFNWKLDY